MPRAVVTGGAGFLGSHLCDRLLERGDARNVGDLLAAGSEAMIEKRLRAFADAGVTDVSVRVVPIGEGRDELIASSRRTRDYLASLDGSL